MTPSPDQAHSTAESNPQKPSQSVKPAGEAIAGQAKRVTTAQELKQAHQSAEAPEKRKAAIGECVELPWNYFDIDPKTPETLKTLVNILYEYECEYRADDDPEYDVTEDDADFLKEGIIEPEMAEIGKATETQTKTINKQEQAKAEDQRTDTADKDKLKTEADQKDQSQYTQLVSSPEFKNKSAVEKLQLIAKQFPEQAEAARSFLKIISLAQTPEDQQLITRKVNGLNFAKLPDPVAFIQHQIFDTPEQKSGFSEKYQETIAKAYGIPRLKNATATDIRDNTGLKRQKIDPKTGEVHEEYVFTEGNKMSLGREGMYSYVTESGQKMVEVDGEEFAMPEGTRPEYLRNFLDFLNMRSKLRDEKHLTEFFGWPLHSTRMPSEMQLNQLHRISDALLGGSKEHDGDVRYDDQTDSLARMIFFVTQKGQRGGAFLPNKVEPSLKGLGFSATTYEAIDIGRLKTVGSYLREHPYINGEAVYTQLQQHLDGIEPYEEAA